MIAKTLTPRHKEMPKKIESTDSSADEESSDNNDHEIDNVDENRLSDDNDYPMSEDDDDADDSGSDGSAESEQEDISSGNAGWASSLAKVLQQEKPKNKKMLVLSKAKKTSELLKQKAEAISFEIDGEIKESKPDTKLLDLDILQQKEKKNKNLLLRIKPSLMDRERERAFKKIATKGVVQLFNAVRVQQKDISQKLDEAGPLDHRRDAVLNNINKRKFLDVLMGGARAKSEMVDNPIKDEIKEESDDDDEYNDGPAKTQEWGVLRNDFMTNKKLSNWDKDENESNGDDDDTNNEKEIYNSDSD